VTQKLWTTGDMAKAVGISRHQAANWPYAWKEFPAPVCTNQSGTLKLYSEESAQWAIEKYLAGKSRREDLAADKARAARILEWLGGQTNEANQGTAAQDVPGLHP
jgi:hypothetical protein